MLMFLKKCPYLRGMYVVISKDKMIDVWHIIQNNMG